MAALDNDDQLRYLAYTCFYDELMYLANKIINPCATELSTNAYNQFSKAKSLEEVRQIFANLETGFRDLERGDHSITDQLHKLLQQETTRIAKLWHERSPEEKKLEAVECQLASLKIPESTEAQEVLDEPSEKSAFIGTLPQVAIEQIFSWLPISDKSSFFKALASKHHKRERGIACTHLASQISAIGSDVNARNLYKSVFGEDLSIAPHILQRLDDAIQAGQADEIVRIEDELFESFRRLKDRDLPGELKALPSEVRALLGGINAMDISQILSDLETFKLVLGVIRAHNLRCIARSYFSPAMWKEVFGEEMGHPVTLKGLLDDGTKIAARLSDPKYISETLALERVPVTHIPVEIFNRKDVELLNLVQLPLRELPPLRNLSSLMWLEIAQCPLKSLPSDFWDLNELTHIEIADTALTSLPEPYSRRKKQTYLFIESNRLTSLPESLLRDEKLKVDDPTLKRQWRF